MLPKQDKNNAMGEYIAQQMSEMMSRRKNWDSHWQEISERMWPEQSKLFNTYPHYQTVGEKRNEELYDITAAQALTRFTSIAESLLSPRTQIYHRMAPSDPLLETDIEAKQWFDAVNRVIFKHRYAPAANFSAQNQLSYKSLGAYGNTDMFIDQLQGERGLRYKSVHMSQVYFRENYQGIVDTVGRQFAMTPRQALQKFGDKAPQKIKDVHGIPSKSNADFLFWHWVEPREPDPERKDAMGFPYASVWVFVEDHSVIDEGGYRTFPHITSRWEQVPGEVYGRSLAMLALPAVKTLNEEKKTVIKQGHRTVDPVLLLADDGVIGQFSLKPGAQNFGGMSSEGRPLVGTLPTGNLAAGIEMMEMERADIKSVFMLDLFQILVETPTRTATEVLELVKEKGMFIAPTIGQQEEYLANIVDRELDLLMDMGQIPPIPDVVLEAGAEYKLVYDSPLSRTQRAEQASGFLRTVETALNLAAQTGDMSSLDHFNMDVIIPELADIQGVPARWLKTKKAIEEMRAQRQAEQEQANAITAAPGAAAMTKAAVAAEEAGVA